MAAIGERELIRALPELPDAACANYPDPDVFFPESGGEGSADARAICVFCPEQTACLTWALENREPFGVWAGTTPTDRQRLNRGAV